MDKVTVCTACFYSSREKIKLLDASCNVLGIKLQPFGVGVRYQNNVVCKINEFRRYVSGKRGIVLLVDGEDGFFVNPLEQILYDYEQATDGNIPLIVGSEPLCWPQSPWIRTRMVQLTVEAEKALGRELASPYVNTGVIMGDAAYICHCLDIIIKHLPAYLRETLPHLKRYSDQGAWMFNMAHGRIKFLIDYDSRFQVACGTWAESAYRAEPDGVVLIHNDVRASFVHGNGLRGRNRMPDILKVVRVGGLADWMSRWRNRKTRLPQEQHSAGSNPALDTAQK